MAYIKESEREDIASQRLLCINTEVICGETIYLIDDNRILAIAFPRKKWRDMKRWLINQLPWKQTEDRARENRCGMSIEECKASCPSVSLLGSSPVWRGLWALDSYRSREELYLHVQNGRIEKVSVNTPTRPSKIQTLRDAHFHP